MMPGIREAQPTRLAAGHRWARQEAFQAGAWGTVISRAAASGTARQFTVRRIRLRVWLNNFRLGTLFGHFWRPSLLRRVEYRRRRLLQFYWARGSVRVLGIREARPALLAAGHRWARQEVFQAGTMGTVVSRAAASGTARQPIDRRIRASDRLGNFRPNVLFHRS
jgi:hypothetical protein